MRFKLISFLIIISFFYGCNEKEETSSVTTSSSDTKTVTPSSSNVKKIETPSKVTLKTIDGKEIEVKKLGDKKFDFDNYSGKVVLLNFFATWCMPCRAEMPHLVNLQKKYKDKDFVIIAVLLEKIDKDGLPIEELRAFIEHNDINFPVTVGIDNNKLMERLAGGNGSIPFMIMYDKDGNYFTNYKGSVPEEMIKTDIKSIINK